MTESRELHLKPRYTLHEPATVQMGHAGHSQWKTSAVHQSVPQIHQRHPSPSAIDWEWHWKYRAKQLALESGLHGPSSSWPQQFWGRYKTLQNYRGDLCDSENLKVFLAFAVPSNFDGKFQGSTVPHPNHQVAEDSGQAKSLHRSAWKYDSNDLKIAENTTKDLRNCSPCAPVLQLFHVHFVCPKPVLLIFRMSRDGRKHTSALAAWQHQPPRHSNV